MLLILRCSCRNSDGNKSWIQINEPKMWWLVPKLSADRLSKMLGWRMSSTTNVKFLHFVSITSTFLTHLSCYILTLIGRGCQVRPHLGKATVWDPFLRLFARDFWTTCPSPTHLAHEIDVQGTPTVKKCTMATLILAVWLKRTVKYDPIQHL